MDIKTSLVTQNYAQARSAVAPETKPESGEAVLGRLVGTFA